MPNLPSQSIACAQCGERFVFSDAERAFYDAKGLLPPRRCKACRDARKSRSGSSSGDAAGARERTERTARGERFQRTTWVATCSGCGAPASVPFEPTAGRDVFCAGCWRARRELPSVGADGHGAAPARAASWGERAAVVDAADADAVRDIGMPAIIE